ncbi:Single-strand binding protein family protein, partial [Peptostreptococcus russellii]
KGKLVAVQGAIRVDRYETQGGEKRIFTKVSGRNIQLLEKQKNDPEKYNVCAEFKETVEDDDVPF